MKKVANLKGAKALSKNEQKNIHGGSTNCASDICQHLHEGARCGTYKCCRNGCCRYEGNAYRCGSWFSDGR